MCSEDNNLEKDVMVGVVPGTRGKGRRPRGRSIQDWLKVNVSVAAQMARDRGVWRKIVH